MKGWPRVLATWGVLLGLGYVIPRYIWLRQGRLPAGVQFLHTADGKQLAMVHIQREHPHLVVVVHGLLKSMHNAQIVALVRALESHYDVLVFDLPGHGRSEGETDLSYVSAAAALREVLDYAASLGYTRTGVIGYSMGAAAAIMAVAAGAKADALVSVSCPTSPITERGIGALMRLWPIRAWLRLMGTRVASQMGPRAGPLACVGRVAPVPLFVIHNGLDTVVRREEGEALYAAAKSPKHWLYLPGVLHAWPMPSAPQVIAWLQRRMPDAGKEQAI